MSYIDSSLFAEPLASDPVKGAPDTGHRASLPRYEASSGQDRDHVLARAHLLVVFRPDMVQPVQSDPPARPGVDFWSRRSFTMPLHMGLPDRLHPRFDGVVRSDHFTEMPQTVVLRPPTELLKDRSVRGAFVPSGPVDESVRTLALVGGRVRYVAHRFPRFFHEIRGSFEDFLQSLNSNRRKKFRRMVRRAEGHGATFTWREYRRPDEMDVFHEAARVVSEVTYQERWLDMGLPDSEAYVRRLREHAEKGSVRGYLLFHGDDPVAYLCGSLQAGGVLVWEYGGYDPAYRQWSPGTLLDYYVLQSLYDQSEVALVDFTEGDAEYKRVWATGSASCADVYFFRLTPYAVSAVLAHAGFKVAYRITRSALRGAGLDGVVRRWLRSRHVEAPAGEG